MNTNVKIVLHPMHYNEMKTKGGDRSTRLKADSPKICSTSKTPMREDGVGVLGGYYLVRMAVVGRTGVCVRCKTSGG